MADQSRPRRVSRNPTGRPRKVAGQRTVAEPAVQADQPLVEQPSEPPGPPRSAGEGPLGGGRTTIALLVAVVLLLGIGATEVGYLVRDDDPTVSAARPVTTGELTHRAAVETAARSTEEILSTSYEDYDDQVEQATEKMTDTFAEQYRQTSAGIRDQFLARRTQLQVKAVAQGVVQAAPDQVQALLFLDQYVQKVAGGEPRTDYRQYRALVTVVKTGSGWLVSDLVTQ